MSALADRPDNDNNDDTNKDKVVPSFTTNSDMSQLPIEKQFVHKVFISQIENINLAQAKELLESLHLLYLGQSALFTKLAKQEFLDNIKSNIP
jgi:hypothetical protein